MRVDVSRMLRAQGGVISRRQALAAGMSSSQIDMTVRRGTWERLHAGVYRLTGAPVSDHGLLLGACLARPRAVASHESAAWLWDLVRAPPPLPTLSVPRSASHRTGGAIVVRQVGDLTGARVVVWKQIPCTNPLRTLVDLAGVVTTDAIDEAVDRALMSGLVTAEGLGAEMGRLTGRGRRGAGVLRHSLLRRGVIGAPHPSVLESRVLRLLAKGGIRPCGVEVKVDAEHGRYRLDVVLSARVALEVDGYIFHGGPGAMGRDLHRHNDLAVLGRVVLRFTWTDVVHDGDRVLRQIGDTLRRFP